MKQNATGWSEGKRVWGGGIIKVKNWVPWPIDLDPDADILLPPPPGQGGPNQNAPLAQPPPPQPIEQSTKLSPLASMTGAKRTVSASGSGLTTIEVPALEPGEGNVHSGATPPWLLDAKGQIKDGIILQNGSIKRIQTDARKKKDKSKKPQKLGADLIRTGGIIVAPQTFLPNFSSLWRAQHGSRLERAQEFRKEMVGYTIIL